MQSTTQLFCFDFTLGADICEQHEVIEWLSENCKKWCFQKERGEDSDWEHYQGRFSLKAKTRMATLKDRMPWPEIHLGMTAKCNQGNDFYVSKADSRIAGPWKDSDKVIFVPNHLMVSEWRPWQSAIIAIKSGTPGRAVHMIIDHNGNNGKSVLVGNLSCNGLATEIPFCNDYRDIMRMVMGQAKVGCYFIDMPRAIGKDKLRQLFAGIESIKNGYAYDDRYKFKCEYFQQPHVFVFSNTSPDITYLSPDRWMFWTIEDNKLVPYCNSLASIVDGVVTTTPQPIINKFLSGSEIFNNGSAPCNGAAF